MDWYLDAEGPDDAARLRHELMRYLRRHAEPGSSTDEAELVVAEVLGNAVKHAGGPVWVSLSWRDPSPLLTVRDLGPGFDPQRSGVVPDQDASVPGDLAEGGRGLFLITHLASGLDARRHATGTTVRVVLPVTRRATRSHDPGPRETPALPDLEEARPDGGFGRESFLRALVVQLAQTLELQEGQDAADAAVAQVGTDIGGQMEAEYRAATEIVGRLGPEELADCYVRLKHAIDGDFYVIEATPERIVLGNRRCPFGDVVTRAPSLCRMTSSVFGGIAARNSDVPVHVLLEERIAVGDDGCRVVVHLGEPPEDERPYTHRYAPRG